MFSTWAHQPMVSLVRRSFLTLQSNLKPLSANASKASKAASPPAPQKNADKKSGGGGGGGSGGGGGGGGGNSSNNTACGPCAPKNPPQCCDTAFDFKGKTILVTGAAKGFGRSTTTALTACGAMVIAVDNNSSELKCLAEESCGRVIPVCVDICDWDKTTQVLTPFLKCPLDGVVNNAGILIKEPFLCMTKEGVQKQLLINVVAPLNIGMLGAQNMIKHKRKGTIVNLASICSKFATDNLMIYCVTKGAVAQATRSMAAELGCHGIRVNAVSPTAALTDLGKAAIETAEFANALKHRTPLGRLVEICEVVDLILYLLGDRSTYVNGANVPVDGGFWTT